MRGGCEGLMGLGRYEPVGGLGWLSGIIDFVVGIMKE